MRYRLYILVILLCVSFSAHSQKTRRSTQSPFLKTGKHYLGMTFSASYSGLMTYTPEILPAHGAGGTIGFVYEYKYGNFMMNTGVNLFFYTATNRVFNYETETTHMDSQGKTFDLSYSFARREDRTRETYLQLPLLLGGTFNKFYIMGGAKLNFNVRSRSYMSALATTIATYDRYFDSFENMPNHGLVTRMMIDDRKEGVGANFDAALSLEMGYNINLKLFSSAKRTGYMKSIENNIRVAVFVDYGLINIHNGLSYSEYDLSGVPYQINEKYPMSLDAIVMYHTYSAKHNSKAFINNINVGVKFTFLLNTVFGKCHWFPCARSPYKVWGR